MKLVVPVKQAATLDEDVELTPDGRAVEPDCVDLDLNEWDAFSVEAALELREGAGGGEIVAVTVGDEEAEEALLACLAMGADRAVRVWDEALAGPADPLTVAALLAAATRRESPDLVLCGVQSSDAATGATGVALAGLLDLPHVAVVRAIEAGDGELRVERELEGGLVELLATPLPALLTVQTGINEPRYATFRAIKQAREKPLDVVTPDALGVPAAAALAAAGATVLGLAPPEQAGGAQVLDGDAGAVAAQIADLLAERVGGAA